jgi:hypothetical protein
MPTLSHLVFCVDFRRLEWRTVADDQPLYKPNRTPAPPRQPSPRKHVWALKHGEGGRVDCALLSLGESWGWSAELYRNDAFYGSRRFQLHADALRWADHERDALKAEG